MSLHSALDTRDGLSLASPQHDARRSLDPRPASCGSRSAGPRWHCAWTKQGREHDAEKNIRAQGFEAYLPMILVRYAWREAILPAFPRYVLVRFDADHDAWGAIANTRGVCGLIRHAADKPTPLPDHAITELLARTSTRGIVDDPGECPWEPPQGRKPLWQGLAALDAGGRSRLLVRLFGESVTRRHMEIAA